MGTCEQRYVGRGRVASELAARMAFVPPLRIAERGTGGEDGQSRAAASAATPGTTGPALRTTWPRLLVHARWWVLSAWAVVGALAVVRAGGVAERLDVRGGSLRVTEASRVDELLATRFRQDIGETFLVLVTGPEAVTGARPRRLLDALCSALAQEPYVREVTWFGSTGDSSLLSADRRTALALVTLRVAAADSVLKLVVPLRAVVRRALTTFPDGAQYRALVTGDTPLERDMLTVTTEDVTRSELRLLPVAAVILYFACGSLAGAALPLVVGVVAVAVALALTLLPALLAVLGTRLERGRITLGWARQESRVNSRLGSVSELTDATPLQRPGRAAASAADSTGMWMRWASLVTRRPGWALLAGALVLAALIAPARPLRIGLPARHWWPEQTEAGQGLDLLAHVGGVGYVQPVRIVVDWPHDLGRSAVGFGALRGLRALSDSLAADPRVREVHSLVGLRSHTSLLEYLLWYSDLAAARAREPAALDRFLSVDGRATRLDVVLADTTSLLTAMDVVHRPRRLAAAPPPALAGARILVGGYVAQNVDFQDDMLRRLPLVAGVILGATALMLGVVFRSVLIPLKAIVLTALSVGATLGLLVLVYQRGTNGTAAIFVAVPVLVFAVVFGLGMDYEVFLLSRIKEAFDSGTDDAGATIDGLSTTAGVITAAALLMIVVFGAFAFARVLVIRLLGFGLAAAVLLDATVIRLLLVPAVMRLAGRWNWWPGVR